MTRVAMTLLLVVSLAGLTVWAGDLPNIADDRDMEAMINEAGAGIVQVLETAKGPILWEITVSHYPQLVGEANTEDWRRGPTTLVTLWSPGFGDAFGLILFEVEMVTLGTATNYAPVASRKPDVGNHNPARSNSANSIIYTDDGDVIGLIPEAIGVLMGGTYSSQENSANSMVPAVNHNSSRSNKSEEIACPWGDGGEGHPGGPFLAAFAELEVASLIEASCPWLSPIYIETIRAIAIAIHEGALR
jgi:hypothetical protein